MSRFLPARARFTLFSFPLSLFYPLSFSLLSYYPCSFLVKYPPPPGFPYRAPLSFACRRRRDADNPLPHQTPHKRKGSQGSQATQASFGVFLDVPSGSGIVCAPACIYSVVPTHLGKHIPLLYHDFSLRIGGGRIFDHFTANIRYS